MANQYEAARDIYAAWGVDTEEALRKMDTIPVSINCWQLDDLTGFEDFDAALTGGIAPGKPRSVEEYFVSLDKMLSLVPGAKHLALHAVYPLTNGVKVPRNEIRPEHFAGWVDYAREKGIGLDFNPTYFSHPMLRDRKPREGSARFLGTARHRLPEDRRVFRPRARRGVHHEPLDPGRLEGHPRRYARPARAARRIARPHFCRADRPEV